MIVQDFTLDKYGWYVRVYYSVKSYNLDMIEKDLMSLGCPEEELDDILEDMSRGKMNTGYIYSNIQQRKSIIIIGPTISAEEFQDTFDHEKGHLAMHICIAHDIDPFSEEFQYLNGSIGHAMFKVAKMFLCDHCRPKIV